MTTAAETTIERSPTPGPDPAQVPGPVREDAVIPMIRVLLLLLTLLALPATGLAQSLPGPTLKDDIVAQLAQQGFVSIKVSRTLLGRLRFQATSAQYTRELVVNPATGEILRDYWQPISGTGTAVPILIDPSEESASTKASGGDNSGSGSSGGTGTSSGSSHDDHEDEQDDPDEPDEPESGDDSGGHR